MILGDSIIVDIAECVKNCDVWKMHLGIWSEERTPGNACRGGISDQSATFLDALHSCHTSWGVLTKQSGSLPRLSVAGAFAYRPHLVVYILPEREMRIIVSQDLGRSTVFRTFPISRLRSFTKIQVAILT